jgi:hypothetical protein
MSIDSPRDMREGRNQGNTFEAMVEIHILKFLSQKSRLQKGNVDAFYWTFYLHLALVDSYYKFCLNTIYFTHHSCRPSLQMNLWKFSFLAYDSSGAVLTFASSQSNCL